MKTDDSSLKRSSTTAVLYALALVLGGLLVSSTLVAATLMGPWGALVLLGGVWPAAALWLPNLLAAAGVAGHAKISHAARRNGVVGGIVGMTVYLLLLLSGVRMTGEIAPETAVLYAVVFGVPLAVNALVILRCCTMRPAAGRPAAG